MPHSQRIIGMVPEMGPGGESLVLEYMTGPVGTCMVRSPTWDERFPETLLFADNRTTNALFGNRTRLSCTYDDSTTAPSCRATIIGTFPLFDSIQPLGRTCSGVNECMAACSSGSSSCIYDCVAWEQPDCGDCAKEQLFHECAAAANQSQYDNLARCEEEHCGGLEAFRQWLPCMMSSSALQLDIMQATLLAELPKGTCNRDEESCVYVRVSPE
jgi:hypothetical protein